MHVQLQKLLAKQELFNKELVRRGHALANKPQFANRLKNRCTILQTKATIQSQSAAARFSSDPQNCYANTSTANSVNAKHVQTIVELTTAGAHKICLYLKCGRIRRSEVVFAFPCETQGCSRCLGTA